MSYLGKKVAVTGAGGFIGSHLCEFLVAQGAKVTALVHYRGEGAWGHLENSPVKNEIKVIAGNILDPSAAALLCEGTEIVFHLAALISIPYSWQAPLSYLKTNAEGTLTLLEAARRAEVASFVHTSSSEVYGQCLAIPMEESHPQMAHSPYAASKIAGDQFAFSYYRSFQLPVTTVRPFNTYGPRQSARAVIPSLLSQALYGKSLKVGNLSPTRDFNFVDDIVRGFALAAVSPKAVGETIHLCSGEEVAIGALIKIIQDIVPHCPPLVIESERQRASSAEVYRLCGSARKAAEILGWKSETPLVEGLAKTLTYLRENSHRYRPERYAT